MRGGDFRRRSSCWCGACSGWRWGSLNVGAPKRDLISGLQLALEKGELRIARRMKEVGSLVRELMEVRGEHDDLVIALALACWRARRKTIGFGQERLL
jgi:hypothetical protein